MINEYKITLLSPVHIGSGEKLSRDMDYFFDDTGTYLFDLDKFFADLDNTQVDELSNSANVNQFIRDKGFNRKKYIKRKISPQKVFAYDINQCIRDSFENPYIPGSSLKGALRTIIASHLIKSGNVPFKFNPGARKEWAFEKMDKEIFGKDPKYDFMKGFMVVDSTLTPANLSIMLAKVYTLGGNNVLSVKLTRPDNPRSEMSIYCEFLRENASSDIKIKIDDFFFTPAAMKELEISDAQKQSLLDIGKIANAFAKDRIEEELAFFSRHEKMAAVTQFYQKLLKKLKSLDNKSFIVNLGWGTGWHFKTGNYITGNDLDRVRKNFDLGKFSIKCPQNHYGRDLKHKRREKQYYCYQCRKDYPYADVKQLIKPFPKSRKVLFDYQEKPFSVPGWILLTYNNHAETAKS